MNKQTIAYVPNRSGRCKVLPPALPDPEGTTMQLSPIQAPAAQAAPLAPARWARWWKAPLAAVDYAAPSRITPWREAWIPTERTITGTRTPSMVYGGTSAEAAIEAAHALARATVSMRIATAEGRFQRVRLNPAMAVLLDAKAGAYWITPLHSSVQSGSEWIEMPHSIDGAAFEGARPWLAGARVASASADLIAVVGRDLVIAPERWHDAPDDSRSRAHEAPRMRSAGC